MLTAAHIQRELGLRGRLTDFIKMAWSQVEPGSVLRWNWHLDAIGEHLEAVSRAQIRRLAITIPPGCMKSLEVSVFWPAWHWTRIDPGARWIVASFDHELVLRDARAVLAILQSDWYTERWGDKVSLSPEVAAGGFKNNQGGWRLSTTPGGKATGWHADVHIYDDLLKPLTLSKATLEEVRRWRAETMPSRFRDLATSRIAAIMQRLHEDDPAGEMAKEQGCEVLRLPMRFEKKHCSYTSIGGDLRTEEGELLWPDRFPAEEIDRIEVNMGPRAFAAQYQQRPTPESGLIFLRDWFKTYEIAPAKFDTVIQSWDLAFKGSDTSDYVVGQVWGVVGAAFYLLDQYRERANFPQTVAAIRAMTAKWPQALVKLVEDKANGPAVADTLQRDVTGIILVNPEGGKVARANACAPLFAAGNVWDPSPRIAPWILAAQEERAGFPFSSHDDSVDATTQALNWLHLQASRTADAMRRIQSMENTTLRMFIPGTVTRFRAGVVHLYCELCNRNYVGATREIAVKDGCEHVKG